MKYLKVAKESVNTSCVRKIISDVEFEELMTSGIEDALAEPFETEEDYDNWFEPKYEEAISQAKSEKGFDAGDYYLYIK